MQQLWVLQAGQSFLTIFEFTDLAVLLLQLLTDLLHRNVVAHGLGHLVDHLGGSVTCCSNVVTLTGDTETHVVLKDM